jgi:hypothetical protein
MKKMDFLYLNLAISVEKEAPSGIAKASFPLRYGKYSEIQPSDYEFIFWARGTKATT